MTSEYEDIDEHIITDTRIISLNSKFATTLRNGTKKSSVIFDFPIISAKDKNNLYHTIALQSAEITASYYNVNSNNNTIYFKEQPSVGAAVEEAITIPEGNYDANTFATEVVTQFDAGSFAGSIEMIFNEIFGKFSLESTINGTTISIIVANTTSQILLGIDPDTTSNPSFPYANPPSFFDYPANFLGVTKIKIYSDALAGGNLDSGDLTTTTLIDTIGATAVPFGITLYNSLGRETYVKAKRIEEIDIQIKDQDDRFIDFNNTNWTMTLTFNTHRRETFSKHSGLLIDEKLRRENKAKEKTDSLKKELAEIQFDDLDILE